jgi:DNA end-binding protein Ku
MSGREHLMAITAPPDKKLPGLMAYTLRYGAEMRDAKEYFTDVKPAEISEDSLALAKELIQRKAGKFDPAKFTDDYETALRELVDAKLKHLPLPLEKKAPARGKVVNLMDALRRSVNSADETKSAESVPSRATKRSGKHGLTVVGNNKSVEKRRKSA